MRQKISCQFFITLAAIGINFSPFLDLETRAQPIKTSQVSNQRSLPLTAARPKPKLNLPASNLTINTLEAIGMRQDLQELLGRVENSINTAQASRTYKESSSQLQAITNAKQFLKQMPDLVQSGNAAEVRNLWQQARQDLLREYPTNVLSALPEVRAIWLDRGTIVAAGSELKLAEVFDRIAAAGANTVFFETVNAGYTVYPSAVAPQQNPLIRGWDPLASAVKLAHARKMELHAWVWVFGVGNTRHNALIGKPASYPGPILELYPEWANREQDGSILAPESKYFLDPANPAVQNYLLSLYKEIVTRYAVDGLQLDYIRYPRQDIGSDFGFGKAGRQKFAELTGIDPINLNSNSPSLWWMWTDFRVQQVNQFVARVSKEIRQIKPNVILSAAVFPWKSVDRINKIQQNWETWVMRGDLDLLVPMTYAPDTSRFLQQNVQPALLGMAQAPVLFLPGVLIQDIGDNELLDKLQALRDLPAGGYSLFASQHLRPSFEGLLKYLKSDQDGYILPYRNPFGAAKYRYAALKKEWQILLQGDRLWVRGESLIDWQKQIESLDRALNNLAQYPNPNNLKVAITSLDNMQTNLPNWMRLENLERSYRVSTWSNRLEAIETILRYGDRTMLMKPNTTAQSK